MGVNTLSILTNKNNFIHIIIKFFIYKCILFEILFFNKAYEILFKYPIGFIKHYFMS